MPPTDTADWPADVEVYDFDGLPHNRDCVLLGESDLAELRRGAVRFLSTPDGQVAPSPSEKVTWRHCCVERSNERAADLLVEITTTHRWHADIQKLPRSCFITCVEIPAYSKGPYLVVAQEWFDDRLRRSYSLYALVDVIEMKALLEAQGKVTEDQMRGLRDAIEQVAESNPEYTFLTFADNVLIKSDWLPSGVGYDQSYQPERFLRVIDSVFQSVSKALGLTSYCVITQGSNGFTRTPELDQQGHPNHIFFGGLGTPFAEIFEIEHAARQALKAGSSARGQNIYMSKSVLLTLQFDDWKYQDELRERCEPFRSKMTVPDSAYYLPITLDEILTRLRQPSSGHPQ